MDDDPNITLNIKEDNEDIESILNLPRVDSEKSDISDIAETPVDESD